MSNETIQNIREKVWPYPSGWVKGKIKIFISPKKQHWSYQNIDFVVSLNFETPWCVKICLRAKGPEILIPNFLTNLVKTVRQISNNNHCKLWPINPHVLAKLFWQLSQNCGTSSALKIKVLFPFVSVIKYANLPIVQSFHYTTADTRQIH